MCKKKNIFCVSSTMLTYSFLRYFLNYNLIYFNKKSLNKIILEETISFYVLINWLTKFSKKNY